MATGGKKLNLEKFLEEIRLNVQKFVKKKLTKKRVIDKVLTKEAAKFVSRTPKYVYGLLTQKGTGGLDAWAGLYVFCLIKDGLQPSEINEKVTKFFSLESPLSAFEPPSKAIEKFKNLLKYDIVNEDTLWKIADNLDLIINEMNSNQKRKKK